MNLEKVIKIAVEAHTGQVDKGVIHTSSTHFVS